MSFSSSYRNKVDLETYLVLKKGHASQTSVQEKARYKILAIENEPPDFIRVEPRKMGKVLIGPSDYFDADGEFGIFNTAGQTPENDAPTKLENDTAIRLTNPNWNGFLNDYEPKGDLKIRVVGRAGGEEKASAKWETVTYQASDADQGIIRWRRPFGSSADVRPLFTALSIPLTNLELYFRFSIFNKY